MALLLKSKDLSKLKDSNFVLVVGMGLCVSYKHACVDTNITSCPNSFLRFMAKPSWFNCNFCKRSNFNRSLCLLIR